MWHQQFIFNQAVIMGTNFMFKFKISSVSCLVFLSPHLTYSPSSCHVMSIPVRVSSCRIICRVTSRLFIFTLVFMFLLSCMHVHYYLKLIINLLRFLNKSHLVVSTIIPPRMVEHLSGSIDATDGLLEEVD